MDDVCRRFRGVVSLVAVASLAARAPAGPIHQGFDAAALPAAASTEPVRFFGHTFDALRVNAQGNVSFAAPLPDFAPVPLGDLRDANIAPFFAHSDAVVNPNRGSGLMSGGAGTRTASSGVRNSGADGVRPSVAVDAAGGGGAGGGGGAASSAFGGASPVGVPGTRAGDGWTALRSMFPVVGGPDESPDPTALASELLQPGETGVDVTFDTTRASNGIDGPVPAPSPPGVVGTPEPGTLVLGLIGAAGLFAVRRRTATR